MSLLDALLLDPAPLHVWIAFRTDGNKGSGTISDPFNGRTQALFDARMKALPANTCVHLGPGTFETKGYPDTAGWQIKPGMKLVGSGIDVTTLKVVSSVGGFQVYAVGHDLTESARADRAEVSDLTIDCNVPPSGAGFSINGAVRLMGDHVWIRRVKAFHWGAETGPCVVFSVITAVPVPDDFPPELASGGIEDCMATAPSPGHHGTAVVFHAGGPKPDSFTREYHGLGPRIRNCFADGNLASPNPAFQRIVGLAMNWCRGGVAEGNHLQNVDQAGCHFWYAPASFRDLAIRNNVFRNVGAGLVLNTGALGANLLSANAALSASAGLATVSGGGLDLATLAIGDRVSLSAGAFTGSYEIAGIQTTLAAQLTLRTPLTGSATVTSLRKLSGLGRAIIEGNLIELAPGVSGARAILAQDNNGAAAYTAPPDYACGDLVIRNNLIRYLDGATPDDEGATLIEAQGVKELIVQNNLLETRAPQPLSAPRAGSLAYFDNRTLAGALLEAPAPAPDRFRQRFHDPGEETLVTALFNRF